MAVEDIAQTKAELGMRNAAEMHIYWRENGLQTYLPLVHCQSIITVPALGSYKYLDTRSTGEEHRQNVR